MTVVGMGCFPDKAPEGHPIPVCQWNGEWIYAADQKRQG